VKDVRGRDAIKASVDGYLEAVFRGDADAVVGLYSDEARIEDPIGADPMVGTELIRKFFSHPRDVVAIERLGPITIFDRWAAFQFRAALGDRRADRMPSAVVLTEMMRFDDDGRIAEMIAIPDVEGGGQPIDGKILERGRGREHEQGDGAVSDRDMMTATVEIVLDAMLHDDVDRVMTLYSDEATIEDPIGRQPMVGADALRSFFAPPRDAVRIERFGPITIFDRWAAFQFRADLGDRRPERMPASVVATQIVRFDDRGRIDRMIQIPDVPGAWEPTDGRVFARSTS